MSTLTAIFGVVAAHAAIVGGTIYHYGGTTLIAAGGTGLVSAFGAAAGAAVCGLVCGLGLSSTVKKSSNDDAMASFNLGALAGGAIGYIAGAILAPHFLR